MGKFDTQIKWYRERRDISLRDLADLETGTVRHFDLKDGKKIEVTQELIDHLIREIAMFDRLIKAYETLHAKGT